MIDNLSIAVHVFLRVIFTSFSVDDIFLMIYVNFSLIT